MGGIAACLCMACGGNDSKDYWGDTSGGGDKEPTENPNASKPRYIWIDAAANFPDFANSKENIAFSRNRLVAAFAIFPAPLKAEPPTPANCASSL